jgi:hypothetical protein
MQNFSLYAAGPLEKRIEIPFADKKNFSSDLSDTMNDNYMNLC